MSLLYLHMFCFLYHITQKVLTNVKILEMLKKPCFEILIRGQAMTLKIVSEHLRNPLGTPRYSKSENLRDFIYMSTNE